MRDDDEQERNEYYASKGYYYTDFNFKSCSAVPTYTLRYLQL